MPTEITFYGGGTSIVFTYDAQGNKLMKAFKSQGCGCTYNERYYIGGVEYLNSSSGTIRDITQSKIDLIPNAEGFTKYDVPSLSYKNNYVLRDHLGNTRVVFQDKNGDGIIDPASEVVQVNAYYPFGLNHGANVNGANGAYKYQYNGKEFDDDNGLNWNDYGARFYDAAIGRWNSVDPFAGASHRWSPYKYGNDNPIGYVDHNGNFEISEELLAKYPNLLCQLENIRNAIKSNSKISDALVKYAQYKDRGQILSLFDASDRNITLIEGNLMGKDYALTSTNRSGGKTTNGFSRRMQIVIDERLLKMMSDLSKLSKESQVYAERIFEATIIHELAHAGDEQDRKSADAQPLQFESILEDGEPSNPQGATNRYVPYKEIGRFIEREIYGRQPLYQDDQGVNDLINSIRYGLPAWDGGGSKKSDTSKYKCPSCA